MSKKLLLFLCVISIGIAVRPVLAQRRRPTTPAPKTAATPTLAPDRQWLYLEQELCSDTGITCSVPATNPVSQRRSKLFVATTDESGNPVPPSDKLEPDADTYIFECLATSVGSVCTSNVKSIDEELYGEDRSVVLNNLFLSGTPAPTPPGTCGGGYAFEGLFSNKSGAKITQPIKSNGIGELDPAVEWQSCYPMTMAEYMALNFVDGSKAKEFVSALGGQQQAQFEFEVLPTDPVLKAPVVRIPRPRRIKEKDPYGRVFDSQTLEPVPNVKLVLTKLRTDGTFTNVNPFDPNDVVGGSIVNPFTTKEDGYFSFIVPDGTYRLEIPAELNPDIKITTDSGLLNPSYRGVYSDIYPLYTGVDIVQKGQIQHRDIPVNLDKPVENPPKLTAFFYDFNKTTGEVSLHGKVNSPLLQMKFYALKLDSATGKPLKTRVLSSTTADKLGNFDMQFFTTSLKAGESYGEMEMVKTDVSGALSSATAQSSSILNPILNYVEGYAKDEKGAVIPNAKVGIYLALSKKPYFETTADENGFYSISSENIPPFTYTIRFTSQSGTTADATTLSIALENPTVNMNEYARVLPGQSKAATVNTQTGSDSTHKSSLPSSKSTKADETKKTNEIVLIVIILLLLVGGAVGIFLALKKKNTQGSL